MKRWKPWLYLLPALLFLAVFLVYPLIDVCVYSLQEGYNSASQQSFGTGLYNFAYVLRDPYFLQALRNTFLLVVITVPLSTMLALLLAMGLRSIRPLRELFQTIFFLPYVTNTLAVGLVFMILFKKTAYTDGLVNLIIRWFGGPSVDFIDGPYAARMFVMCFYTIWVVLPFKVLILTSALASVNPDYYKAARVDGTSAFRTFRKITLPMISPMLFYLVITGFIGAFKAYSVRHALRRRRRLSFLCVGGGPYSFRNHSDDHLHQSDGEQEGGVSWLTTDGPAEPGRGLSARLSMRSFPCGRSLYSFRSTG